MSQLISQILNTFEIVAVFETTLQNVNVIPTGPDAWSTTELVRIAGRSH